MATFTNQLNLAVAIRDKFKLAVPSLQSWLPVWAKMGYDKKLAWLDGNKSPLLIITMLLYMYLRKFYAEMDDDIDSGKITGSYSTYKINVEGL